MASVNPAPILPVGGGCVAITAGDYVSDGDKRYHSDWDPTFAARVRELMAELETRAAILRFHSRSRVRPLPFELLHTPVRYGVPF